MALANKDKAADPVVDAELNEDVAAEENVAAGDSEAEILAAREAAIAEREAELDATEADLAEQLAAAKQAPAVKAPAKTADEDKPSATAYEGVCKMPKKGTFVQASTNASKVVDPYTQTIYRDNAPVKLVEAVKPGSWLACQIEAGHIVEA